MNTLDDPRMKKLLQQLIARPETMQGMELADEDTEDADAMKVAADDGEYELPEGVDDQVDDLKDINTEPNIQKESVSNRMKLEEPKFGGSDPEIMEQLKKLKAGQPLSEDASVAQETASDPSMDTELRKAAIQKIKQKYLGK